MFDICPVNKTGVKSLNFWVLLGVFFAPLFLEEIWSVGFFLVRNSLRFYDLLNSEHFVVVIFSSRNQFTRSLFTLSCLCRTIPPELELFQQLDPIKCLGTFHPKRIFLGDATNKPSRCFFQNIPDMCKTTQFSTSQLVKLRSLQTCLEPRPSGCLDMTRVEMVWSYMPSICLSRCGTDTHILLDHQLLCWLGSSCWFVASYDAKRGNKALRKIFKRQFLSTKSRLQASDLQ